ncbi:MAG: hypothetical protein QM303_10985 [Bacillota bacterium]|nr:hypothetical protein [Bacillota bacterium]
MSEPTTAAAIRGWLEEGRKKGATHCLVICDTWDPAGGYEDYPRYVMPGENAREIAERYSDPNGIERLVEVYNLSMDLEEQLKEVRARNF